MAIIAGRAAEMRASMASFMAQSSGTASITSSASRHMSATLVPGRTLRIAVEQVRRHEAAVACRAMRSLTRSIPSEVSSSEASTTRRLNPFTGPDSAIPQPIVPRPTIAISRIGPFAIGLRTAAASGRDGPSA